MARPIPAKERRGHNVDSTLDHRLRRWPSVELTLCPRLLFSGLILFHAHRQLRPLLKRPEGGEISNNLRTES